ncbi:MAG: hypothetical protein K6T90_11700 [Leptolyngbyaceae cyanobacterium HOT.MB2.61]|nr:hypothetical protein [Leptolyngbyaceae cyanobacterium HOT.MB2.61]
MTRLQKGRSHLRVAIAALSIYQQDEILWQQVCQRVEGQGDADLQRALKEL